MRMRKRRILLVGSGALAGLLLLAVAIALCFLHRFSPNPPPSDFPPAADALAAQRQDVEQFARLLAMDRSFSPAARAEANRRIAELNSGRTPLAPGAFRVALMRIAALADNGHTQLYDRDARQPLVPVRVTLFADGLYVLRAKAAYADLLGARVEKIEASPVSEVLAGLAGLQGGAEGWRRTRAAIYIESTKVLYGLGLGSRPDQTAWTFRLPDGSEVTRTLPGEESTPHEPLGEMTRWLSPETIQGEPTEWRALLADDAALPLPLRDFNSAFRRAWINHGCTLFLQLKAIGDAGGQRIADFLNDTTEEMHAHAPCNVILDMRFNSGGDYTKAARFASHLPKFVRPGGRIYLLTGPQTFSAAITTIGFVKQAAPSRALILGEPIGDRLQFYGEGNAGCLPHASLCVHYATGMHDYAHRCDDWRKCFWLNWLFPLQVTSLAPDETITLTYADYIARRDPVFDRALALADAGLPASPHGTSAETPQRLRPFDIEAHRGGRALRPENTLPAFANALAIGVDTLELDLGVTKDGVVVVSHDRGLNPDLARARDGRYIAAGIPYIDLTLAQVRTYDVGQIRPGSAYAVQFPEQRAVPGTRIPTLSEVCALVRRSGNAHVRLNIEPKIDPNRPHESLDPDHFVAILLALLRRERFTNRVMIQSFDWRTLLLSQKLAPQIPTVYLTNQTGRNATVYPDRASLWTAGYDPGSYGGSVVAAVRAAGGKIWSPNYRDLDARSIAEAHVLGVVVIAWTVNDAREMADLIDEGVDGIISDRPDVLRTVAAAKGISVPRGAAQVASGPGP